MTPLTLVKFMLSPRRTNSTGKIVTFWPMSASDRCLKWLALNHLVQRKLQAPAKTTWNTIETMSLNSHQYAMERLAHPQQVQYAVITLELNLDRKF